MRDSVDQRCDHPEIRGLIGPVLAHCLGFRTATDRERIARLVGNPEVRIFRVPVEEATSCDEFPQSLEVVEIDLASVVADPICERLSVPTCPATITKSYFVDRTCAETRASGKRNRGDLPYSSSRPFDRIVRRRQQLAAAAREAQISSRLRTANLRPSIPITVAEELEAQLSRDAVQKLRIDGQPDRYFR